DAGQATTALFVPVREIRKSGAPGVCSAAQKPDCTVKFPPLAPPTSGWPSVPVTRKTPPVLVPPPPAITDDVTANTPPLCAMTIFVVNSRVTIPNSLIERFVFIGISGLVRF